MNQAAVLSKKKAALFSYKELAVNFLALLTISCLLTLNHWFSTYVYYHHFFDQGIIIFAYNISRVLFTLFTVWLLYCTGYLCLKALNLSNSLISFTHLERVVLSFSIGIGIWHIFLLTLGLLNLYYESLLITVCSIVFWLSLPHLKVSCLASIHYFDNFDKTRLFSRSSITTTAIVLIMFWLLLVRGLYPGGGHDYYVHYFYYYMSVLKNHGLSPNDVWYHYYYSKGAGLHFLGMLLSDPLAPPLITYSCVVIASIALYSIVARVAPLTLWPTFSLTLYLLYNMLSLTGNGGDFQKIHEETSALVIISVWALSLYEMALPKRPLTIALILTLVALAILTPAISVFFSLYFGIRILLEWAKKDYKQLFYFLCIGFILAVTTCILFAINYLVTGLISDQSLNATWRLANIQRLNNWGILPNLMLVAWIRDNYDLIASPWNVAAVSLQLAQYVRIFPLSLALVTLSVPLTCYLVYLISSIKFHKSALLSLCFQLLLCALASYCLYEVWINIGTHSLQHVASMLHLKSSRIFNILFYSYLVYLIWYFLLLKRNKNEQASLAQNQNSHRKRICILIFTITVTFTAVAIFAGHSQATSFFRFSSFFFPLLVLFISVIWGTLSKTYTSSKTCNIFTQSVTPVLLILFTVCSWENWFEHSYQVTASSLRLFSGQYSLADAYQNQLTGHPFGGLHLGTWNAVQHAPPKARIWSTTVVSYCMAPDCQIESVISFKFSSRVNEILTATPARAAQILKEEGLNYFLFLSEFPLLDYLPYSQLFSPKNIGKYLAVEWTDGKTYLLTWRRPEHPPLSVQFIKNYTARVNEPEDPSFKFSLSIPYMTQFMNEINHQPPPLRPIEFPWHHTKT